MSNVQQQKRIGTSGQTASNINKNEKSAQLSSVNTTKKPGLVSSRSAVKAALLNQQQQSLASASDGAAANQTPIIDRQADFAPKLVLQSRIERLRAEQEKYKSDASKTQESLQQSASESDDLILYLDKQVRQRDAINKQLQSQLDTESQQHRIEMSQIRSEQAAEFETATRTFASKLDELYKCHSAVNQSLLDIRLFCQQKSEIESDLKSTTERIITSRQRHLAQLAQLEQKYELASKHLLQQSQLQLQQTKQTYKHQIELELDIDHAADIAQQKSIQETNQMFHTKLQQETDAIDIR
jgi:hypothetical protein